MSPTAPPATAPSGPGKWWKQGREEATTSGAAQKGVAAYWEAAAAGQVPPPASRGRPLTASHISLATGDDTEGQLAVKASSYAQDFTSKHQRVGRRGVAAPPEAAQARAEAAAAAARNRAAGRVAHVTLDHFADEDRAAGLP